LKNNLRKKFDRAPPPPPKALLLSLSLTRILILCGSWSNMAMAAELVLKDACSGCGATLDLYGSGCRHLTLCAKCGKTMAETAAPCSDCGVPVTRLIRVRFLYPCPRFVCSAVSRATHVFLPPSLKLGSELKFLLLLSVSLTKVCIMRIKNG
jgi:hypothetical protein